MKKHITLIMLIIPVIMTGCLLISINPYYTKDTLVFPDNLEGTWYNEDTVAWTFVIDTAGLYRLTIDERYKARLEASKDTIPITDTVMFEKILGMAVNEYKAGVTIIDGVHYLDLLPEKMNAMSGFHTMHFFAGHSISKLKMSGDTIWINSMEDEWVKELSDKKKKKLDIKSNEKGYILTASTKKLRKMIANIADSADVFDDEEMILIKAK
jgi:hypothetical protein